MKKYNLVAKTFAGLEEVLANEINEIGGENVSAGRRAVFYQGDLKLIYKSNYFLRTALRVLKEISVFHFNSTDQFYLRCKKIDWKQVFDVGQSFMVNSNVNLSKDFRNSMFASLKTKDAIADYFRDVTDQRPNVDTVNPEIIIDIHIFKNTCTVSLDSSGESLHKRGYRVKQGDAPLNEVLAAGMIKMSGWEGRSDFLDPMCGSGTLPIEATLIAHNIPAGRFRKKYAFTDWPDFDELMFEKIKQEYEKKEFTHQIVASDISTANILNAKTNARRSLVFNKIDFRISDFRSLDLNLDGATIIMNPPYGERLIDSNLNELYAAIGERLKHQYPGNSAWILSSSNNYIKNIGLKPSRKIELYNGALQCQYLKYKLFAGKRSDNITT